ncbi:MAG: hypothetical protein HC860_16370 [Alkalinema sp. RU_4_3]|nr:hypothetical protein [Alkalinema sp. RU_4_3]
MNRHPRLPVAAHRPDHLGLHQYTGPPLQQIGHQVSLLGLHDRLHILRRRSGRKLRLPLGIVFILGPNR